MSKFIKSFLLILLVTALFYPLSMSADQGRNIYVVSLIKLPKKSKDHNKDIGKEGQRSPSRPMMCIFSEEGIQADIAPEEILSYELWDQTEEFCIASFTDEASFLQYLFSYPGEFQIRIETDEYTYVGYLSSI